MPRGDGTESSEASGDTPVSQSQLNLALAQVAQMQQETSQIVHQMQTSLQQLIARPTQSLSGATSTSTSSSSTPAFVSPTNSIPNYIKLTKPSLFTGAVKATTSCV
jgi:hypothetical protein